MTLRCYNYEEYFKRRTFEKIILNLYSFLALASLTMTHIQVILYNSSDFIPKICTGLNNILNPDEITVHFLENSEEKNETTIKDQAPTFAYTYTKAPQNLGFGKGHNFLFKKYGKDYGDRFIILNPDIIPFYDFLQKIEDFEKQLPDSWGCYDLAQFPEEHPKEYNDDFETDWASGAASVFNTRIFKEVEGFDEAIFMYNEDVDICWRIRERGSSVFHCPTSKILHVIGSSSRNKQELLKQSNSSFQLIHSYAGNLYLRYKYFGHKEVEQYRRGIKDIKEYDDAMKQFNKMKKKIRPTDLKKFRSFSSPKIYPDSNYAQNRW